MPPDPLPALLQLEARLATMVVLASLAAGAGVPPEMRNSTEACRGTPETKE